MEAQQLIQDELESNGHWTAGHPKKGEFLVALERHATVRHAAREVGISKSTLYLWRKADPDFAKAWDAALASGRSDTVDELEVSMKQRALEGDTTAAFFLMKNYRPSVHRERGQPHPYQAEQGEAIAKALQHALLQDHPTLTHLATSVLQDLARSVPIWDTSLLPLLTQLLGFFASMRKVEGGEDGRTMAELLHEIRRVEKAND